MPKQPLCRIVCLVAVLLVGRTVAVAQTAAGDLARGQGAYLRGLGSYNLNTAQANSINVDAMIKWKKDLRKIQAENRVLEASRGAGKKLKIEEVRQQQLERERQLRLDPSPRDVEKGDALNVLVYDLTDPDIKSTDWSSKTVPLPPGISVKDLIFRFTPQRGAPTSTAALSQGVIALSRLDIKGKWPIFMAVPALDAEKSAYEDAYGKVRDQLLADQFEPKTVIAMDRTLDALKAKVMKAVPAERDYRAQALKFVDDLKDSTRLFDAGTVDYAKDILNDTQDHDATTVAELVSFMLKYRLQFATAERSSTARELYPKLYVALRQQAKDLGIKPPEVVAVSDAEATAEKLKAMQGTWICISSEEGGTKFDATAVKEQNRQLVISGNNYALSRTYAKTRGTFEGKFEIDAKTRHFDFAGKAPGGKHVETTGIFEVNGDTLKLCYRHNVSGNAQRTDEFKSDGNQPDTSVFFVFKRAK